MIVPRVPSSFSLPLSPSLCLSVPLSLLVMEKVRFDIVRLGHVNLCLFRLFKTSYVLCYCFKETYFKYKFDFIAKVAIVQRLSVSGGFSIKIVIKNSLAKLRLAVVGS